MPNSGGAAVSTTEPIEVPAAADAAAAVAEPSPGQGAIKEAAAAEPDAAPAAAEKVGVGRVLCVHTDRYTTSHIHPCGCMLA